MYAPPLRNIDEPTEAEIERAFAQARQSMLGGEIEAAREEMFELLSRQPNVAGAYLLLAEIARREENRALETSLLRQATLCEYAHWEACERLIGVYLDEGNYDEAFLFADRLNDEHPERVAAEFDRLQGLYIRLLHGLTFLRRAEERDQAHRILLERAGETHRDIVRLAEMLVDPVKVEELDRMQRQLTTADARERKLTRQVKDLQQREKTALTSAEKFQKQAEALRKRQQAAYAGAQPATAPPPERYRGVIGRLKALSFWPWLHHGFEKVAGGRAADVVFRPERSENLRFRYRREIASRRE